jgi:hypothetical protein
MTFKEYLKTCDPTAECDDNRDIGFDAGRVLGRLGRTPHSRVSYCEIVQAVMDVVDYGPSEEVAADALIEVLIDRRYIMELEDGGYLILN